MSPLAKVFVVLNLLLAVLFLGTVSTLFTTRDKYVTTIQKMKTESNTVAEKANQRIASLEGSNRVNREANASLSNDVNRLTSELATKSSDLNSLKVVNQEQASEISSLNTRIGQKDKHIADKDSAIQELTNSNNDLLAANQKAREEKTISEQRFARALLDLQQANGELAENQAQLTTVSAKLTEANDVFEAAIAMGINLEEIVVNTPAPAIDGVVMAIRPDANLVVLSVGSNDNVRIGHEFTIYRHDTFVGKVKVTKVTPDLSGARIMFSERAIDQGDRASTRVGV